MPSYIPPPIVLSARQREAILSHQRKVRQGFEERRRLVSAPPSDEETARVDRALARIEEDHVWAASLKPRPRVEKHRRFLEGAVRAGFVVSGPHVVYSPSRAVPYDDIDDCRSPR